MTISLCMIVKNEEGVLARCLDSLRDLVEEIIIVDTGSTDNTKEIAATYTDKVFDFPWMDDFSAARNFAFSKATQEYIYSADADEVLDEENRQRFLQLKETLLPEVEIVQMLYGNQLAHNTVYNFDQEYRPKLFKRQRNFVWEEPIHEAVRLQPVVFDSEVVITHMPTSPHGTRDLAVFANMVAEGKVISKRLHNLYARELFLVGEKKDFAKAVPFFAASAKDANRSPEEVAEACLVVARGARLEGQVTIFFQYIMKVIVGSECAEACYELGLFYLELEEYEEAVIWFYNARYETTPILSLQTGQELALQGLITCYEKMGNLEQAESYKVELNEIANKK